MRPRPPSHSTSRRCSASPCWRRSCIRSRTSWSTSRTSGSIPGRSVVNAAAVSARGLRLPARAPILANPLNLVALALIAVFAFCALFAPLIAPYDPLLQDLGSRLMPPSPAHWLGTDSLGRDIASRILYGARISLIIGVVVVASAGVFGTVVGLVAGYAGGLVDEALMRLTEVFLAFPALILAMAIAGALGPSLTNAIIAIAAVTWAVYARLTRGQILSLRRREFVEAARAIGASRTRIVLRHLLPNVLAPLLVQARTLGRRCRSRIRG